MNDATDAFHWTLESFRTRAGNLVRNGGNLPMFDPLARASRSDLLQGIEFSSELRSVGCDRVRVYRSPAIPDPGPADATIILDRLRWLIAYAKHRKNGLS